jgi:hypothetical protein
MVFQVLPHDFNGVEFRAVWRQVHQHQAVLDQPFVQFCGVDVVMGAGIVQDDQGQGHPLLTLGYPVNQGHDRVALDGSAIQVVPDRAAGPVQRADHVHPRPGRGGIRHMGLTLGRPRPLHVGHVAEAALVQVEQAQLAFPGRVLATLEVGLGDLELVGATFFFSVSRVRLKVSPRFLRWTDKQSRLKGGASGWTARNCCSIWRRVQGEDRAICSAVSTKPWVSLAGAPP